MLFRLYLYLCICYMYGIVICKDEEGEERKAMAMI